MRYVGSAFISRRIARSFGIGYELGGSGAALEGSFLAQRRRIKELQSLLIELEGQRRIQAREMEQLKGELEEAETKKSLLGAEIHRLDLERVRLEHENDSADQELVRLTQTVQALVQEQNELASTLQVLKEEIQDGHKESETIARQKMERERLLAEQQAELSELRKAEEGTEAAVTQSRVRNAALGEKRENAHLNLENRLGLDCGPNQLQASADQ